MMKISMFAGSCLEGRQHPLPEFLTTGPRTPSLPPRFCLNPKTGDSLTLPLLLIAPTERSAKEVGALRWLCPPYLGKLFYSQVLGDWQTLY